MRWFSWWGPQNGRESPDLAAVEIERRKSLLVRSRGMPMIDSDLSDLESPVGSPSSPFAALLSSGNDDEVCEEILNLVRDGSGIQDLVDSYPEDVISVLKHHSVVKLGTFQATDSDVLKAFGQNTMLTRGCEFLHDPDWEANWKDRIKQKANQQTRFVSVGWEEMVSLGAYAVNIRNVAARDRGALLQLLLMKYSSGATSKKIWEFPAVRAVINYHWEHWARKFLLVTAVLFLCWIGSFTIYLTVYIEAGDEKGFGAETSFTRVMSYFLSLLSFIFMVPFAIMEYWTMIEQGWRWFQPRNAVDICLIALQTFIFASHLVGRYLEHEWFGTILAFQCVFLFAKLQNFGRVLGAGASISEIFISVVYDVRYLLLYILLTGVSASLCLGAIYKHDSKFRYWSEEDLAGPHMNSFSSFRNTLVTTFQIIFGGFDTAFIFKADHPWVKVIFFFGLQTLMTITVLNLLIAVMTESYSKFATEQRIRYNRGRASVIDELEVLRIQSLFSNTLHPYVHYLVVEKRSREATSRPSLPQGVVGREASRRTSLPQGVGSNTDSKDELKKKIDDLTAKVDALLQHATYTQGGFPPGTGEPSLTY